MVFLKANEIFDSPDVKNHRVFDKSLKSYVIFEKWLWVLHKNHSRFDDPDMIFT
jgi:hypothetical protein